jgi:hypothetical protein
VSLKSPIRLALPSCGKYIAPVEKTIGIKEGALELPKGRIFSAIEQNEIPELSHQHGQKGGGAEKDNG